MGENHKVLFENAKVRLINVYGEPFAAERYHVHRRYSLFLQYGQAMPITQFDENHRVVHESAPADPAAPMRLTAMWWPPQWLHSNYYKNGSQWPTAPNCPLDDAPHGCNGFFYRLEFKLPGCALLRQFRSVGAA